MSRPQQKRNLQVESPFPNASALLSPGKADAYNERTLRNRFWVGGDIGQQRIRNLKLSVAGLGGIGGAIAEALVRLGVGHLRIADLDRIEKTNINRQVMAKKATLGQNKAEAMAAALRDIADDYELVVYNDGVHAGMVEEFVEGVDAIVDEIDVFALDQKVRLHRAARERGLALYTAYAVGLGVHFYKFQGNDYTLEDFLGSDFVRAPKPSGEYLLEKIGAPLPPYIDGHVAEEFARVINTGGAPIFGPATLLGHSIVTTRLIMDLMAGLMHRSGFAETPVMPEFLVLDAGSLEFRRVRVPG